MLQALGVTAPAEAVYVELLRHPGLDDAGLARALGCSAIQIQQHIDELRRLDLVRSSWEDPGGVRAVPPEVGIGWLLSRRRTELRIAEHEAELSGAAVALVAECAGLGPPAGLAPPAVPTELTGPDAIRDELERLVTTARHEVLVMVPEAAPAPATLAASRPGTRRLLDRGVRLKTLYLSSTRRQPAIAAHARWLASVGAEVRTRPVLPLRMMVFDGACAVVPTDPGQDANGACVLRGRGAVALALAVFRDQWAAAALWPRPVAAALAPTDAERALLALLLDGETDDRVARKLGVSARTVGRMVADLMGRLGARSRFQAGALAVTYGWVGPGSDRQGAHEGTGAGSPSG